MSKIYVIFFPFFTSCFMDEALCAQSLDTTNIKVLLVMAHPDDESFCTGTVYKLTHDYNAKVDLACITNGEGGYKYSTLLAFVGVLHRLAFVGVLHQQIEDEHKHKIVGEEHQRW